MKTKLALASACLVAAASFASGARAADTTLPAMTPSNSYVAGWGGHFVNQNTPTPEFCNIPGSCDRFTLPVNLGAGYLASSGQVLQIGVAWKPADTAESEGEYDTIDLYVYDPSGQLVASSVTPVSSSMGIASTAQVVNVPNAVDGDYTIDVVPFSVVDRVYRGVAMLQSTAPAANGALLPDLISMQPTNFKFATGADSLAKVQNDNASCYAEETAQDGTPSDALLDPTAPHPTRCLRFDAGHANIGAGPFYLDVNLGTGAPTTYQGLPTIGGQVSQIIENSDGTETSRPAGNYYFHIAHGHIHYKNFATYSLYRVVDGARTGDAVISKKSDFCMIDVDDLWFGQPGAQPRTRHFPQCNALDLNRLQQNNQLIQRQGIDRGWADWYTWDLPGQYIDFTNMPDGVYDIVNTVNPTAITDPTNPAITESDTSNDTAFTRIHVVGNSITCIDAPGAPCPVGTSH